MCHKSDPVEEQKILRQNPNRRIVVWKGLSKLGKKSLTGPFYPKRYVKGNNYAYTKSVWGFGSTKVIRRFEFANDAVSIYQGIHVCRSKRYAERYFGYKANIHIVKCTILAKDIIATNKYEYVVNCLNISSEDYSKAVKENK